MSVDFDADFDFMPTHRPTLGRAISTCGDLCSQGRCPNRNHACTAYTACIAYTACTAYTAYTAYTVSDAQIATALNHPNQLFGVAALTLQIARENKHYVESPAGVFTMADGTDIGRIAYLLDIFSAMGIREKGLRRALQNSEMLFNSSVFLRVLI